MLDFDYDLRDEALRDLLKNYKSNLAKKSQFEIKYRSLKRERTKGASVSVLSKKWNKNNNFYSSIFRPDKLCSSEPLPTTLEYTSRLIKTPLNQYYISIPKSLEVRRENQAPDTKIVSIDPGSRTFFMCYDPSGKVYNIGSGDAGAIARLLHYKKKLSQRISLSKLHKQRYKMKLAILRINQRIYHKVDDFHKRACKWLCENFTHIVIPKLNFHNCKNLSKRQKEILANLRHCGFVDRLVDKAREYPWCNVKVVSEAWTSKTCGRCGWINAELDKDKTFKCQECGMEIDRDINGSRNILLRAVREHCVEA